MEKDRVKAVKTKLIRNLSAIGLFFLAMGLISSAIGKFIDNKFGTAPYGMIGTLLVSLVINWFIIFYVYMRLIRPDIKDSLKEKHKK